MTAFGKASYERYREFNHGVSAVTGEPLPEWDDMPVHIQSGWDASAEAVALVLAECPVDEDAPQPAHQIDPDCPVCAKTGGPHGVPQPAPELAADNSINSPGPRSEGVLAPELAALREQLSIANGALRDIRASYDTGTAAHDWAHRAQDEIGTIKPQPPREADALREELADIRDRLGNLARGLKLSASASSPSKKSDIERACATAVLDIARTPS